MKRAGKIKKITIKPSYDVPVVDVGRTEEGYAIAISKVLSHIQAHLDDPLTPCELADVACFSQHHFHRIFRAVVGESVMDHIRRLRLERAAYRLKTSQASVGSIALDAGYGAQEAFTRTFQAYFGLTPRCFRSSHAAHRLPTVSGVHFGPGGFSPLRRAVAPELLSGEGLCDAHRDWADDFEERWEELLELVSGFAALIPSPPHPDLFLFVNPMTETLISIDTEIDNLQNEVEAAKQRLLEARKRRPKEPVKDYILKDVDGNDVHLSELFGDKDDLILIHNMGTGCAYCTLWADGFVGLTPHISDRAAFVLCSPDAPDVQKRFAAKRNWNFKMGSAKDSTFIQDMGFWQNSGPWPGVSTFKKDADGQIYRIAKATFGPGDDFCATWPFLDLLSEGANGWEPKYAYGEK